MPKEFHNSLPKDLPTSKIRYIGKEVNRIEDPGLVSGMTEFIDNLSLPNMLHCAILRSPHPHARIVRMDTSAAEALEGVAAVLTGEDVKRWGNPMLTQPEGWGTYCLAVDKVRFVGEPVAAVAATSRYLAEDALELIQVEYELLKPVADPEAALAPDASLLYDERGTNVMFQKTFNWGDVDKKYAEADHVISNKFRWNRVGANPTETFGCVSQWDLVNNSLTSHGSYQVPGQFAMMAAVALNLPFNKVKIVSHPHGGSFGGKGGVRGTPIAAMLSRKADGRPVKYIEDRMEYLLAGGGQSWDRYYDASLSVKADGTVTGFKVKLVDNQGATGEGYGTISVAKPLAVFTGNYRIEAAQYEMLLVLTNRCPTSAYRGYGPPPHYFVLESLMDMAARKLGLDPTEIRRRNYIQPDQFPYTIPSGNEYDSGNYEAVLDKVLKMADYRQLREEQVKARAEGRLIGISVVNSVEPGAFDWNVYNFLGVPGVGVPEGVRISVDLMGNVTVIVGFNLEGQGQYTFAAQLVADYLGVEMDAVRIAYASSDVAPPHFGPGGSRLAVVLTGAILSACEQLKLKFSKVVAHLMQTTPDQIELMDGRLRLRANPEVGMYLAEVVGTMLMRSDLLPPDVDSGPEATYVWVTPGRNAPDDQGRCRSYLTAANATHLVQVEVDKNTGRTKILKYIVVDDCGTRLNPASVDGQQQGGVAQGIGAALYEEYVYDDQAQPMVSTFMDYLIPTINEVPDMEMGSVVTPSPVSPLGAKGCGEGSIHITPVAVMCAVNDALSPLGLEALETPASPRRIWKLLHDAGKLGGSAVV